MDSGDGYTTMRINLTPLKVKSQSHSVLSDSLWPHGLHSPWNSPGQNTGVVAFPFSRGTSQPSDRTQVSHTAGGSFTSWTVRLKIVTLVSFMFCHNIK